MSLWDQEIQELLIHSYEGMKLYNWHQIASRIGEKSAQSFTAQECRNKYIELRGNVSKKQWTEQEEQELYRLHDENGNRWTVISFRLIGRTENCVKNHFYSKLRKTLRGINKIVKNNLKKIAKQVSDCVIFKLTEATDEILKKNPDISAEMAAMCYDLKNSLLRYEHKNKGENNFQFELRLVNGLNFFNKNYKKKPKKERIALFGSENLKKGRDLKKKKAGLKKQLKEQEEREQSLSLHAERVESYIHSSSLYEEKSEQEFRPRKMLNLVLKEPSKEQVKQLQRSSITPAKKPGKVEDILRAEGILEQGQCNPTNIFRRDHSSKSFSICSDSSHPDPDMFGDSQQLNLGFNFPNTNFHFSEAGDSSQFFNGINQ